MTKTIHFKHFISALVMLRWEVWEKAGFNFAFRHWHHQILKPTQKLTIFRHSFLQSCVTCKKAANSSKLWDGNKNKKPPMSTEHATSLAFNKPLCNYNGSVFIRAPGVSSKRPAASWKAWLGTSLSKTSQTRQWEISESRTSRQCRPASNTQQRINWGYEYIKTHHSIKKIK